MRIAVLEEIAASWNEAGLDYAVTHGLEGYPDRVGRDLDVLVQSRDISLAMSLASGVLESHGWRVACPSGIWGARLVATRDDPLFKMVEVHAIPRLSWRNVVFATRPDSDEMHGPFRIDPWLSLLKRAVIPLLARDFEKWERIAGEGDFAFEPQQTERLEVFFGRRLGADLVEALSAPNLGVAGSLSSRMRRSAAIRGWWRHPLSSSRLTLGSIIRRLQQPLSPCAPTIAVVGPDGIGKSSLIRELARQEGLVFNDVVLRHWRPGLLPQLGSLVGRKLPDVAEDGLRPPRRSRGRFPWIRVSYYAADTALGTLLKDRVAASRQKLIVYDRCFLDMAVDPLRYGLSSNRGVLALWRILPRPDLIVLLRDSPDRVHARKPELAEAEIARQLAEWEEYRERGLVQAVLQVDAGPDVLLKRLLPLVGEAFHSVNRTRGPVGAHSP